MTLVLWELVSVPLEIVLVSVQDRCTVCDKCTRGLDIVLVRVDIVLILTQGRSAVCAERTIGSEIDLDTPDGTPR